MSAPKIVNQIKVLNKQSQDILERMQELANQVKSLTADDIALLEANLELANKLDAEFSALRKDFLTLNQELPSTERFKLSVTPSTLDSLHITMKARLIKVTKESALVNLTQATNEIVQPQGGSFNPHLPKIPLTKFSGNILDWSEFHSNFDSLVDTNSKIDDVHKFHYLKSALSGEALRIVENFQVTAVNYKLAYDAIKLRYNNKRRIANVYMNNLLNFKPLASNNVNSLKPFLDVHQNAIQALKALNLDELLDFTFLSIALRNLDPRSRKIFEDQQKANVIPTYQQLFDFTLHQVQACELANESSPNQYKVKPQSLIAQSVATTSKPTQGHSSLCICCNQQHPLFTCNKFSALPVNAKYQLLRSCNRCFNCLGAHSRSRCTSKASCRLCNSTQHHTLLHSQSNENSHSNVKNAPVATPALSSKSPVPDSCATSATVLFCTTKKNTVRTPNVSLLGTLVAHISDSFGRQVAIRGVIDPGSQVSFITKSIVNNLHLPFRKNSAAIHGISETTSRTAGTSHCTLSSTIDNSKVHFNFLVLDQISHQIPTVSFYPELLRSIQPLRMADPSFSQPGKIDFLLGADVYPKILYDERPLCLSEGPVATKTIFGWTLIGPITKLPTSQHTVSLMASCDLSEQLTKFWEVEQVAVVPPTDPLELAAEQHFAETHHRNSDGRYVEALPFIPNAKTLANNTYSAKRSLIALEKRLAKQPNLEREYHDFLNEYVDSQHMSPAPSASSYIIPHHVVNKDTNQGPKIRVVFNASSHDAAGSSLNSAPNCNKTYQTCC